MVCLCLGVVLLEEVEESLGAAATTLSINCCCVCLGVLGDGRLGSLVFGEF